MSFKEEVEQEKESKQENVVDVEQQQEDDVAEDGDEEERPDGEEGDQEEEGENSSEPDEVEKERLKKQEEYRERKRKEKEEASRQASYQKQIDQTVTKTSEQSPDEIEYLKEIARKQMFDQRLAQAERELTQLEQPFKEAFDDYDDVVEKAITFTTRAYIRKGMTEHEAKDAVRREKILLADQAAANGLDPVEAVYNEAKNIMSVIDEMATDMGYTKGKAKTNLQAAKEMAKPNAFSGGAGKGAKASKKTFAELDDDDMDEIEGMSLGQMGLRR